MFCEAVKVDDSLSDADLKKNARNTISLLTVLFENRSEAQNWYDDISKNCVVQTDNLPICHPCSTIQMKVMI